MAPGTRRDRNLLTSVIDCKEFCMPDWKHVVNDHYGVAYDRDAFKLIVNPPASLVQIESVESELGFTFPEEWRSLYLVMSGFGVAPRKSPEFAFNLFPSLDSLLQFVASIRDVISTTHPAIALQFVPVINFANGDAVGYLDNDADSKLHMFSHEAFQYDVDQDYCDFLYPIEAGTIEAFLCS